jgi:hypothetical protein
VNKEALAHWGLSRQKQQGSGQLHTRVNLFTGKNLQVPDKWKVARAPETVWSFGGRKKSLYLTRIAPYDFIMFLCFADRAFSI